MNRARVGWAILVLAIMAACGSGEGESSESSESSTGESAAALSFASGNNDGYCASNPSAECAHGTPVAAKRIVLTFDDGPGSQTSAFSTWLRGQGIHATFFVRGLSFGGSPQTLLAQLQADGHLIGNHTQNHLDLTALGDSQIVSELTTLDTLIAPYAASKHYVFRAPFGAWSAHDYAVLHASAMNKYAGPVSWDVGGQMTGSYAADWDCWQNTNGYGVMTTKQCGDRYLREIADRGRGIVLMHDQDYGDVGNHSLTSGKGNTIDMVKYMVPLLVQQGYSFLRVDEVPDIAALFPGGGTQDAGSPVDAGGSCAWQPTWSQSSYANDWWIEYAISGDVASASLEVVGGVTVPLSKSYDKWVGPPPVQIASGTSVVVHARNALGQDARTKPFAYLVTLAPATSCAGGGSGGGGGTPDAGGGAPDAGAGCTSALSPTWSQGSGANNWWVEYAITPVATIASAYLEVVGGETVPLSRSYDKWVGPVDARIATGASVVVHAQDLASHRAQTLPFGYLSLRTPTTQPCSN